MTFLSVAVLTGLLMIADVESTFSTLKRCPSCSEANPIMRPFVRRGRFATYAAEIAINGAALHLSRKLYEHNDKSWAIAPTLLIASHGIGVGINVRIR